jgi:hypothetical protein
VDDEAQETIARFRGPDQSRPHEHDALCRMGGTVPLGYEVKDRKLVVHETDGR